MHYNILISYYPPKVAEYLIYIQFYAQTWLFQKNIHNCILLIIKNE